MSSSSSSEAATTFDYWAQSNSSLHIDDQLGKMSGTLECATLDTSRYGFTQSEHCISLPCSKMDSEESPCVSALSSGL